MRYSQLALVLSCLTASFPPPNDGLHLLEVFAGESIITSGCEYYGLKSKGLDVAHHSRMDILKGIGFIITLQLVRRVVTHGTVWFGIPCSSWVFMSRGSTHRSWWRSEGNTTYENVRRQNKIARRMCYLLQYCFMRGINYVVENPVSSLLWRYRCVRKLLRKHRARRISISLGAYGAHSAKQVILAGTAPWLGRLSSSLTPLRKKQLRRVKSFLKLETVRIYTDETGAKRCAGGKDLKATQVYPGQLGLRVGQLLRHQVRKHRSDMVLTSDQGMLIADSGSESEDSGLESLMNGNTNRS